MPREIAALRSLGLTDYGARAYAALVDLGPSPASDVAQAAPVPRTKVYAVLGDLARRGWIVSEPGRPRRYRALPPRECFDRERARIEGEWDAAVPALEARHADRSRRFGGAFWILDGEDVIAARALEMVEHARQEILLVATFPLPGDEKALARALRAATRRGVRVRLAVPDPDAPHARALAAAATDTRVLALPPRLLSMDGRQALVAVRSQGPGGAARVQGVWHTSPELLRLMFGVLGAALDAAEPVEKAR